MIQYMPYIWAAILVAAIILETQTMGLISIWFMPSALISMILAMLKVSPWIQCLVFAVVSALLLILSKTIFKSILPKAKTVPTNVDALIGQEAIITEEVDNVQGKGSAKLGGQMWTARAERDADILLPGDIVVVLEIRGVKLICRKKTT